MLQRVFSCSRNGKPLQLWRQRPSITQIKRLSFSQTTPTLPASLKRLSESFIDGTSANYVESMYEAWKKDSSSVHVSWAAFFSNLERDVQPGEAYMSPPTLRGYGAFPPAPSSSSGQTVASDITVEEIARIMFLIRAYQVRGHAISDLDPLGLMSRPLPPELDYKNYGFSDSDLDRQFKLPNVPTVSGFLSSNNNRTLREYIEKLKQAYCGTIGVEFMHIQDRETSNWIRNHFETGTKYSFSKEDRIHLLDRLTWAYKFEQFLALKFGKGNKRFGLDGCEVLIPGMKALIDRSSNLGIENVVIGMAHRGRLNVLGNVVRKPLPDIFHEFDSGAVVDEDYGMSGDVKYHLGTSYNRPTKGGQKVQISLVANPSHLEAVNPVVEGNTKAKQYYSNDPEGERTMSILIHGDASFAGQGVVYETINITHTPKFKTGGTIHIVINNQIGFTTNPSDSRGGMYCTDVVKAQGCPVFHVNGDDPEAVVHVFQLAVDWRQKFHKDCVIDIVCYRRFGHNEGDQPEFTQPLMYQRIEKKSNILDTYSKKLLTDGVIDQNEINDIDRKVQSFLEEAFQRAQTHKTKDSDWLSSKWEGFKGRKQLSRIKPTGVSVEILRKLGLSLSQIPEGFEAHKTIAKVYERRRKMFETGEGIDFAMAEALAFGSLMQEGNHVRLTGQDVERGTFSHRHAVIHDQTTGKTYTPLHHIPDAQERFVVANSALSEFGALGYELGYSLENPNALICWEAQFGDFANGAQVIIDQFISCGEAKWMRQSGIVLLLPHGYEGAGPEHSSARIERFLQLSDSDPEIIPTGGSAKNGRSQIENHNWQVVNCSIPSNYFHVLRRQIHREFRKPLIVFTHKSILRTVTSPLELFDDQGEDTNIIRVIGETGYGSTPYPSLVSSDKIKRVVFCTGKVYYDLFNYREKNQVNDVALIRIEQLMPFPFDIVQQILSEYPNAEVYWCQEEHKNMGAWFFTYFHLKSTLKSIGQDKEVHYSGRPVASSPATASYSLHKKQLEDFLKAAIL